MVSNTGKRATATSVVGICSAIMMLGAGPAEAAIRPGVTTTAEIRNSSNEIKTSLVGLDTRGRDGCASSALFTAQVRWHLGKVTASSIEIKSFDLEAKGLRKTAIQGMSVSNGAHAGVWRTTWRPAPYEPSGWNKRNYVINKNVSTNASKPIQLNVNFNMTQARSGEPVACYGQSNFLFQLKPGRYTTND
ncbi:hypothetical protein GCM10010357_10190 [Streptomyces luteireticuli]|uniref:DNRLRE domain-containing protein n=1 Tax=Streptomyces luteireticuli TaxID=173858 RepID=A0ABN0YDI3_9ACTN